jgi:tape measure domain-containing protein
MSTDIASLGFEVDSSQLAKGTTELDRIAAAAKRAEQAASGFGARSSDAAKRISEHATVATSSTNRLADSYGQLAVLAQRAMAAAGAAAAALSISAVTGLADSYSDLNARVGLAVRNMEASNVVMDRLADVARRTYSSLELTAESFIRNASTMRELGRSTNETLDFTEALNLALVVSGAKGDRARMIQESMSRAMAGGALRGQELNTVIESGGRVAEVLAEELGVGVSQLRRLGEQGKITSDVIANSLIKRMETLRTETEKMPTTIGDALGAIRNGMLQLVGIYDQQNKLSATLAEGVKALADNLDIVAKSAAVAAVGLAAVFHASIIAGAVALAQAIAGSLVGAVVALGVALRANPIMTVATVLATVAMAAYQFRDELRKGEGVLGWFGEKIDWLTDKIYLLGDAFNAAMAKMRATSINDDAMQAVSLSIAKLNGDLQAFQEARDNALGRGASTAAVDLAIAAVRAQIAETTTEYHRMNEVREAAELSFTELVMREANKRREAWSWERGTTTTKNLGLDDAGTRTPELAETRAYDRRIESVHRQVEAMKLEAETYGMTEVAAARYRTQRELENEATKAGIELTAQRRLEILAEADAVAQATAALEARRAVEDGMTTLQADADQYARRLAALQEFEAARILSTEESARMRAQIEQDYALSVVNTITATTGRVASTMDSIVSAMDTSSKKQFEQAKKLSLASAVLKGFEAAVSSFAAGAKVGGPWLGAAWAAASLAMTTAQIGKIKSTSFNSSSAGGGGLGGGGSSSSSGLEAPRANTTEQKPTQTVHITLTGSRYSREEVRSLVTEINSTIRDGTELKVS